MHTVADKQASALRAHLDNLITVGDAVFAVADMCEHRREDVEMDEERWARFAALLTTLGGAIIDHATRASACLRTAPTPAAPTDISEA